MFFICLPAYAKRFGPSYFRGPNYELWTFANGQRQWISTTQGVWNGSHWVDYIFQDLYDAQGKYVVQTGLVAVEIFDYYAKFYDPNMTEVRLYDEKWEIQRWKTTGQGSWSDIGAQSGKPVLVISKFKKGVNITKSFHSWAGWLNITYSLAEQLKHTVTWQSEMGTPTTFNVLQKWSGIVGNRIICEPENITITEPTEVNGTKFRFFDAEGHMKVYVNQWASKDWIAPVLVEPHAQGMKCDFIFSNWTLSDRESLTIDPTTSTFYASTWDGAVYNGDTDQASIQSEGSGDVAQDSDTFLDYALGWNLFSGHWRLKRLFFYFATDSIPDSATIISAKLCLYGYSDTSDTDFTLNIQEWTSTPPVTVSDYGYFDGVTYDDGTFNTSSWSTSGYNNITFSDFSVIDKTLWTTLCIRASNDIDTPYPVGNSLVGIYFADQAGTSKDPLLEVTYVPAPTIGEFDAPTITYSDTKFSLACTVNHNYGVEYLDYATMEISASVILKWDNTTDIFSEYSDINNLCILFADESAKTVVNGTAYTLTWVISLSANFPEGSVSVYEENTKIFDAYGGSGSDSQSNLFLFEATTQKSGSGEVDDVENGFLGLPPTKIEIPPWGYWVIGGTITLMGIGALMQSGKKKRRVRNVRTQPKTHKPKRTKRDTKGRFK